MYLFLAKFAHGLAISVISSALLLTTCPNNPFHQSVDWEVWLVSPEDGDTILTRDVTFEWDWHHEDDLDMDCLLWMGPSPEYGTFFNLRWATNIKSHTIDTLSPGTTYYWKVRLRYVDDFDRDRVSEVWSFTTADVLWEPGHMYDPYPDSGAHDADTILNIHWSQYNPDSVDWQYDFYLGLDSDPPLVQSGMTDSERGDERDTLIPGETYYWQVVAYHSTDTVTGPLWQFTTMEPMRPTVVSPSPSDGAIRVDSILTFTWNYNNPHHSTPYFDLYLGDSPTPPLVASHLNSPSYGPDTLDGGTDYYWRVDIYNDVDTVEGPLWTFATDYPAGAEIFAVLEVDAKTTPSGYHTQEDIRVRFDTGYAVPDPLQPLQADSVIVEGVKLNWSAIDQSYDYTGFSMPFIENGQPIDFTVFGNADVPDLSTNIIFPSCTLGIVSPESFEMVSLNGFEVTWNSDECGSTVWLTLLTDTNDSTGVWKQVEDDGADSLTAADLAPLGGQAGTYNLAIVKVVQQPIIASGYIPQSVIRARVYHVMLQINLSGSI